MRRAADRAPYRAALRLCQRALGSLAELDGQYLRATGRGLECLDHRQLCNVVLAFSMEGLDAEQRRELWEELNAPLDPMEQWDQVMGGIG